MWRPGLLVHSYFTSTNGERGRGKRTSRIEWNKILFKTFPVFNFKDPRKFVPFLISSLYKWLASPLKASIYCQMWFFKHIISIKKIHNLVIWLWPSNILGYFKLGNLSAKLFGRHKEKLKSTQHLIFKERECLYPSEKCTWVSAIHLIIKYTQGLLCSWSYFCWDVLRNINVSDA